jgi:hypothetical protein
MRKLAVVAAIIISATSAWYGLTAGNQATAAPAAQGPVTVLDQFSAWRTFQMLKPPVIQCPDGLKPVLSTQAEWINQDSPAVPAGWKQPDFDDATWLHDTALTFAQAPYLARLCQRASFAVTDPAQVHDLKLVVTYQGGEIVYLNGQELARGHLPPGAALADAYPREAFASDGGKLLPYDWHLSQFPKNAAARIRTIEVAIPTGVLHQGVNVLALETVRAPYDKVIDEAKEPAKAAQNGGCPYTLGWNTCQLLSVKLTAATLDGLVSKAARPAELQAWNDDLLTENYESDLGDGCEKLRPVAIKGAANGWSSGKVIVASPKAITGLKAVVTDLQQGAATIPAAAVRVRYGVAWDGGYRDNSLRRPKGARLLDALLEAPPAEFPAGQFGTVVPIWVTVKIPAEAKPGTYTGQLTISAKDEKTIQTPIHLDVANFRLPNQDDYRTWIELIQSPDSLALEYNVPLWSDKHWKLIEQSLRYLGEAGSRTLYVPLIGHTNFGNAESMVRWIKKADGTYDWDYSILDKYLDLAQKNLGQIKFVAFGVWEVYLNSQHAGAVTVSEEDKKNDYLYAHKNADALRWQMRDKGPLVTTFDPATGQTGSMNLPRYEDPACRPLWKPLFAQLRKRMAQRGLEDKMAVSMLSDIWPLQPEVAAIQDITGGLPWINHTHGSGGNLSSSVYGLAPIKYIAMVWNNVMPEEPSKGHTYGWKRPEPPIVVQYHRFCYLSQWFTLAAVLHTPELNITGNQRGMGRIGADFWPVIRNKKGVRAGYAADRYPESFWHSLNMGSYLLCPEPDGPVASQRYEVLREGVQECEARIAMERVLTDPALKARLSSDLARHAQDVLDERLRETWLSGSDLHLYSQNRGYATAHLNHADAYAGEGGDRVFLGSGWFDRTQSFYNLAGEVTRQANAK